MHVPAGKITLTAVLASLAGLACLPGGWGVSAEDKTPPAKEKLPADLARVPRQAVGFLTFCVADLWEIVFSPFAGWWERLHARTTKPRL